MMDIVIASNNKNKLREFRQMLKNNFDNIYSLSDLNIDIDVEETADTFEGNALLKAKAVGEIAHMTALSDDSGLIVDALNGEPGVYSARYSGENSTDEKNNEKLLKNMQGVENRSARFVSAIVLYYPNGKYLTTYGTVEGKILEKPDGDGGFGYDPLFFCNELNKSFGIATAEEKNSLSHRARALENLLKELK
ncbi:MAG: XTP/dITP diphosphatase [Clostridia bacterium]